MDIIFKNKDHETNYHFILEKMKGKLITEQEKHLHISFHLMKTALNICLTCSTSTKAR